MGGRITLQEKTWNVIIDSIDQGGRLGRLPGSLDALQGYGITHVGKLGRCDGSRFTDREATGALSALHYFLSFARGMWSPPVLAVGFDGPGEKVWEEWISRSADRWHPVDGWFDASARQDLSEVFSGFMKRWQDAVWQEPARLSISWYIESNTPTSVQSGIVLTQVGLELLAWVSFVEDSHTVSPDGFDKLPASDRLRLLLSRCGIPLDIPSRFKDLLALAKRRGWNDGPRALTELRNGIVHPKKRRSGAGAGQEATDAWWLGLWYLELVLLHLFEFNGDYSNRLKDRDSGDLDPVPWRAHSSPSPLRATP